MTARPPDHLCGLGYSPSDPRQSEDEGAVLHHAERLLNMVHAYCEIRDSWTGWLRSGAMGRTLHERIVPEMRRLRNAERRIVDKPGVTLLAVLDYAARAREAVPAYTPLGIDHPQPRLAAEIRAACTRMIGEAEQAALAARRAAARENAARMADAIEREREEEARRQRAMREHGVTETADEAARAAAAVDARIDVYERERTRVLTEAGLSADGEPVKDAPTDPAATPPAAGVEAAPTRERIVVDAMRAWTGPRLKWGRYRGAPYLRALRKATGLRDITRRERNRLWGRIEAEAGA